LLHKIYNKINSHRELQTISGGTRRQKMNH